MKNKNTKTNGVKNMILFLNKLLAFGNDARIRIQNIKKKTLKRVEVIGSNMNILKVTTPQFAICI